MLGGQSCGQCHNAHGSPYISLLKNKYITTDYNPWSEGDGDYAACWACHDENTIVKQENAFEKRHHKHVNGAKSPCFVCHDVHSPYDSDEPGLINMDIPVQNGNYDMQYIDGHNGSTSFWISGDQTEGFCYINCHHKNHKPKDYKRDN